MIVDPDIDMDQPDVEVDQPDSDFEMDLGSSLVDSQYLGYPSDLSDRSHRLPVVD
jgi:hypothetical protein